jgi:peptidyl-prolyl cis-trans isomerase D
MSFPAFQENGMFIGDQRYQQLLRMQRPPMTAAEFESNVRRQLVIEKLRSSVTDWLAVADKELEQEYRRRNNKVKLAVVSITADTFKIAGDGERRRGSRPTSPRTPPTSRFPRSARCAICSSTSTPMRDEGRRALRRHRTRLQQQHRAVLDAGTGARQHILLKTEGKDDAAVKRPPPRTCSSRPKPAATFAALAKKYSEDEASAKNWRRPRLLRQGQDGARVRSGGVHAAPGQISDLGEDAVRLPRDQGGRQETGDNAPLADVRQQLNDQLAFERAQAQAADLAQTSRSRSASRPISTRSPRRRDSPSRSRASSRATSRSSASALAGSGRKAFDMKPDDVAGPLRASRGFVFETLRRQAGSVRAEDRRGQGPRARRGGQAEGARSEQAEGRGDRREAQGAPDFEKAAKAAASRPRRPTSSRATHRSRTSARRPPSDAVAFTLPVGARQRSRSSPTTATAVIKVLEKVSAPTSGQRTRPLSRRVLRSRNRFFAAYMVKAKQKMKIEVNREALQRAVS